MYDEDEEEDEEEQANQTPTGMPDFTYGTFIQRMADRAYIPKKEQSPQHYVVTVLRHRGIEIGTLNLTLRPSHLHKDAMAQLAAADAKGLIKWEPYEDFHYDIESVTQLDDRANPAQPKS